MKTPTEMALLVAEVLIGSCGTTVEQELENQGFPVDMINDTEFCRHLDGEMFECNCCNWFCYNDENEDGICEDCRTK